MLPDPDATAQQLPSHIGTTCMPSPESGQSFGRREFLRSAVVVGASLGTGSIVEGQSVPAAAKQAASAIALKAPPMEQVRIGIIGVGHRGPSLLNEFLNVPGVSVRAVCDIVEDRAIAAVARCEKAGHAKPEAYSGNDQIYHKLLERDDIDLVINATHPQNHTPIAVDAMRGESTSASRCRRQ